MQTATTAITADRTTTTTIAINIIYSTGASTAIGQPLLSIEAACTRYHGLLVVLQLFYTILTTDIPACQKQRQ